MRVLDNPIWHSLQTLQAGLGERSARGLARRFQPEVSPFCALSEISPAAWQDMVGLLGGAGVVVCFLESVPETPAGWELLHTEELTQYPADDLQPLGESRGELLGVEDLPEILPLVEETNPGPFGPRTLETGDYIGVRRDGDLVAMAGVRMRMPGFSEVSAVCVHPSARRLGLAGQLTLEVAHRIRRSGDEAFLHVREGNDAAHALYRKLGFRVRADMKTCVFRYPASGEVPSKSKGDRDE